MDPWYWVWCRARSSPPTTRLTPNPAGDTMNPVTAPAGSSDNLDEIVVNGIRRGDLIPADDGDVPRRRTDLILG